MISSLDSKPLIMFLVFEYKDFIPNYNASQEKAYVIKNNYKGQVKYKFLDKAFSESSIKVALYVNFISSKKF